MELCGGASVEKLLDWAATHLAVPGQYLALHPDMAKSKGLFACLLVCLFACLLVCLFACLLVCLFVCLLFACLLAGWLVGWLAGWLVCWLVC